MGFFRRFAMVAGVLGGVSACTQPGGFGAVTLAKGAQVDVRTLVTHGEEIAAVRSPTSGKTVRVVIESRARIVGKDACINSNDIKAGRGNEDRAMAAFVVEFTAGLVKQAGGVCSSYFEAGDGYVLSSRGADGKPFPPGDTAFRILDQPLSLRVQQ